MKWWERNKLYLLHRYREASLVFETYIKLVHGYLSFSVTVTSELIR